jgi:hypothetical protein
MPLNAAGRVAQGLLSFTCQSLKRGSEQIFARRLDTVCFLHPSTEGDAMTTDLASQGDLIAELHLESLFNSGATHTEPEVHFPKRDALRLRHRLALLEKLAIDAQGLSFKTDSSLAGSMGNGSRAALRAAARVADWRSYLPEDCVAAMINDGWHLSN